MLHFAIRPPSRPRCCAGFSSAITNRKRGRLSEATNSYLTVGLIAYSIRPVQYCIMSAFIRQFLSYKLATSYLLSSFDHSSKKKTIPKSSSMVPTRLYFHTNYYYIQPLFSPPHSPPGQVQPPRSHPLCEKSQKHHQPLARRPQRGYVLP